MKSTELQNLTASEPLSLDEEYAMQKSWRNDDDKCTFLILSKEVFEKTGNEIESLVGDTNLFLQNDFFEESDQKEEHNQLKKMAEAEIMIAEKEYRGKKLGWEAMLLMLKYGQSLLEVVKFTVKINENNEKSIAMFKKMFFQEISKSKVFEEITLQKLVNEEWISWLDQQVTLDVQNY